MVDGSFERVFYLNRSGTNLSHKDNFWRLVNLHGLPHSYHKIGVFLNLMQF